MRRHICKKGALRGKKSSSSLHSLKILPLQDKCMDIHAKIVHLQELMKKIERKSSDNHTWRVLLNSAVEGMNMALNDLEKRLDHIQGELEEFV